MIRARSMTCRLYRAYRILRRKTRTRPHISTLPIIANLSPSTRIPIRDMRGIPQMLRSSTQYLEQGSLSRLGTSRNNSVLMVSNHSLRSRNQALASTESIKNTPNRSKRYNLINDGWSLLFLMDVHQLLWFSTLSLGRSISPECGLVRHRWW